MRSGGFLAVLTLLVLGSLAEPAQARFRISVRSAPRAPEVGRSYSPSRSGHGVHIPHGSSSSSNSSDSDDSGPLLFLGIVALIALVWSAVVAMMRASEPTYKASDLPLAPDRQASSAEDFDWSSVKR